ncbi:hypothetical protein [Corallococcus sp. 4LFB]|uniref:hypothetical protein n=1 Tax=Corallococcus sp. 4LFB TaxID=3383249 RepID=UPI0039748A97
MILRDERNVDACTWPETPLGHLARDSFVPLMKQGSTDSLSASNWKATGGGPRLAPATPTRIQRLHRRALRPRAGPLRLPVLMLRGTEANVDEGGDRTRGWAALTDSIEVVDVPGTHSSVLQPPRVESLGRALSRSLDAPPHTGPPKQ